MRKIRFAGEAAEPHRDDEPLTAGVPLSHIVRPKLTAVDELPVLGRPSSPAARRFHRLAERLESFEPAPPQCVVVTSGGTAEGKSFTATNLALTLAQRRPGDVLLLDADLRRPPATVDWLKPRPTIGLAELIAGRTALGHVLLEPSNCPLHVLPSGAPPRDPLELFTSSVFEELMSALLSRYSRIVIDTPPVLPYTDADLVARFSDGVLFVVRCGQTRRSAFASGLDAVTSAPLLGVVLNDLSGGASG